MLSFAGWLGEDCLVVGTAAADRLCVAPRISLSHGGGSKSAADKVAVRPAASCGGVVSGAAGKVWHDIRKWMQKHGENGCKNGADLVAKRGTKKGKTPARHRREDIRNKVPGAAAVVNGMEPRDDLRQNQTTSFLLPGNVDCTVINSWNPGKVDNNFVGVDEPEPESVDSKISCPSFIYI
jgi:hypothetical protein